MSVAPTPSVSVRTAAVVNAVAREKWGIGYGGTAYGKGIKEIKIKKDAGSPGIAPEMWRV